jgi:hypothetical protein
MELKSVKNIQHALKMHKLCNLKITRLYLSGLSEIFSAAMWSSTLDEKNRYWICNLMGVIRTKNTNLHNIYDIYEINNKIFYCIINHLNTRERKLQKLCVQQAYVRKWTVSSIFVYWG